MTGHLIHQDFMKGLKTVYFLLQHVIKFIKKSIYFLYLFNTLPIRNIHIYIYIYI